MKSFTKERVVKNYEVAISAPRLVETQGTVFECLSTNLTVLSMGTAKNDTDEGLGSTLDSSAQILESADKAREIVAQAEVEAGQILERAATERERLSQELAEQLRAEIMAKAYADAYQAGLNAAAQATERMRLDAQHLLTLAQDVWQQELAKVDKDLLGLAVKIAERITKTVLAVEPHRILDIIHELTLMPQERGEWRLHLAVSDYVWITQLPPEEQLSFTLVKDETLRPGDCLLMCQEGLFDARLDAQLDRIEQILREELSYGELEQASRESRAD